MMRIILTAVALLLAAAFAAIPQTHTFPALDTTNVFTGANSFTQTVTGTFTSPTVNPALSGPFRMAPQDSLTSRNNANNADVPLIGLDSIGNVNVGNASSGLVLNAVGSIVVGGTGALQSVTPLGTGNGNPISLAATGGVGAGAHTGGNITFTPGSGNNGGANGTTTMAAGFLYYPPAFTFATLGTPTNGALVYCSDCTIANPCAGAGAGAIAKRLAGGWVCN